ncbi:MAG: polysaccharide biosynthesis protein [Geminicoccaceae bacterium]|nr:polysaccharide biosynthesis protein [Geminicoccaceae bacterium]
MAAKHSSAWLGTSATNTAILLCGLATGVLSARLLAPEGRGALAAVLFWPQLLTSIASLSLPSALIFRRGRPDVDPDSVAATGAWLALALAALAALAGSLLLPFLLRDSGRSLAQLYLLAFVPFNFLALAMLALDQSDMRFARYNLTRLLPSSVYLLGLLVLWGLDAVSVASLVWASWLGTALTAIVRLYHSHDDLRARPSLSEARRLIAFGARLHGAALLAVLLAHADRLIVVTFWDDASLGLYVVALTFANAGLNVVTGSFNTLLLPRLAQAENAQAQRRIMGQTLRYATLLLTAGTAVLLLICPWLLPFMFGHAYGSAVGICLVLLVAYLPTALRQVIVHGLSGTGHWRPRILAHGLALATFAVVVWPLAGRLGVLGIPTALLIANSIALAYLLVFLRRQLALSSSECWGLSPATVRQVWGHGRALVKGARPAVANG